MQIVIMAGGSGTRFWPRSVNSKPKQFLSLTSKRTMLQETYQRFRDFLPKERIYVVSIRKYQPLVLEQLTEMAPEQIILEPDSRDTGPCAALAALTFLERGEDDPLVFAPADHYIPDSRLLMDALLKAEQAANVQGALVTLGIIPTRADSGYGYIMTKEIDDLNGLRSVDSFIEKPPIRQAERLSQQEGVYWNSGILVARPSSIAHAMSTHRNDIWQPLCTRKVHLDLLYPTLPKISLDRAILEKSDRLLTVPVTFVWDDVGSWTSLERVFVPDANGNIMLGDVIAENCEKCIIFSEQKRTVVVGLRGLIIVSTSEGLLVCDKMEEQQIKNIIQRFTD